MVLGSAVSAETKQRGILRAAAIARRPEGREFVSEAVMPVAAQLLRPGKIHYELFWQHLLVT